MNLCCIGLGKGYVIFVWEWHVRIANQVTTICITFDAKLHKFIPHASFSFKAIIKGNVIVACKPEGVFLFWA
jgi:hypothetical protein